VQLVDRKTHPGFDIAIKLEGVTDFTPHNPIRSVSFGSRPMKGEKRKGRTGVKPVRPF